VAEASLRRLRRQLRSRGPYSRGAQGSRKRHRERNRSEIYLTGTLAGTGSFRCQECDYAVVLDALDAVPECPFCGAAAFERASLFEQEFGDAPVSTTALPANDDDAEWLGAVRDELEAGHYLACRDEERISLTRLRHEWTRIGRSPVADVRFDDPTVSRRHALIVRQGSKVRVLDDRSLNGVFHNGERVEWSSLADGDELVIGRYRLHFLDTTGATAPAEAGASRALA
jgi:hypothetical protein